jgi:DNA-binding HxlR family transcriptional regulator
MVKAKTPIKETSYGRDLGSKQACKGKYIPIRDTLDLVGGKWKLRITHALASKPFKRIERAGSESAC